MNRHLCILKFSLIAQANITNDGTVTVQQHRLNMIQTPKSSSAYASSIFQLLYNKTGIVQTSGWR